MERGDEGRDGGKKREKRDKRMIGWKARGERYPRQQVSPPAKSQCYKTVTGQLNYLCSHTHTHTYRYFKPYFTEM